MKNKRASLMDLFIWIAVGFVILLFLGGWIYGHNLVYNSLLDASENLNSDIVNLTDATESSFGQVNSALPILHFLAVGMILAMALSILISNFLIKANPVFFVLYVMITIVAIIFSVFISNAYEDLMTNQILGQTLSEFVGGSFIMLNLPLWVTVVGIIGAVFLFIGITRDRETEGSAF